MRLEFILKVNAIIYTDQGFRVELEVRNKDKKKHVSSLSYRAGETHNVHLNGFLGYEPEMQFPFRMNGIAWEGIQKKAWIGDPWRADIYADVEFVIPKHGGYGMRLPLGVDSPMCLDDRYLEPYEFARTNREI